MKNCSKLLAASIIAVGVPWLAAPASAAPLSGPLALKDAAAATASPIETVQFRRWGWGRGWGPAAGALLGGAIIGGAIAASRPWGYYDYGYPGYDYGYRYSPGYDYGYRYSPGYSSGYDYSYRYDPGYDYSYRDSPRYDYGYAAPSYTPGYVAPRSGLAATDDITYCQQRFRSYDAASGTYLGYDGLRHPCP